MKPFSNDQLGAMLGKIENKMDDGFRGTHARQDVANGRTGKLEIEQAKLRGQLQVAVWVLGLVILPIIAYLANDYLTTKEKITLIVKEQIELMK